MQAVSELNGTFLSTFRINDGGKKDAIKVRQRQRKILSCTSCHRSKVKCDRGRPCGRCAALGRANSCIYSHETTSPRPKSKARSDTPEDVKAKEKRHPLLYYYAGPNLSVQHAGLTHWTRLYDEFEEVREYVFGQNPDFDDTFRQITQLKSLYPSRYHSNFPFGNSRHHGPVSKDAILQHLPARPVVEALVDNYLNTFEKTFRLLHPPSFLDEVEKFWADPLEATDAWLAQLLTMLCLSCHSAPCELFSGLDKSSEKIADECLDWAEAALKRSPFMSFPDLHALRTLIMMTIIKSFDVTAPATNDGQFALIGFIVRMAMSLSLHRDPTFFPSIPPWEARMRRRIWNTLLFLDLKHAIDSGMPTIVRKDDWDTRPPLNMNDSSAIHCADTKEMSDEAAASKSRMEFDGTRVERKWTAEEEKARRFKLGWSEPEPEEFYTDSSLEIKLSQAYPIVSMAVSTMNSMRPLMEYDKLLEADAQLREVLRQGQAVFSNATQTKDSIRTQTIMLQQTMLEIFVRRTLLAMHRPFAQSSPEHPIREKSHWSVLECSLALINLQQSLHDFSGGSNMVLWMMDIFQGSFSCAMIYTVLNLRRDAFDYAAPGQASQKSARETAGLALRGSIDIVRIHVARSFLYFKTFMGVSLAWAALQAVQSREPVHEYMEQTGKAIVEQVYKAKNAEEVEPPTNGAEH